MRLLTPNWHDRKARAKALVTVAQDINKNETKATE